MALVHHELCFGCGRTNLFGLLLEAERDPGNPEQLSGRCFIKQDHQGPVRGRAHPGIVATALIEAMQLLAGDGLALGEVRLDIGAEARVGAFLHVTACFEGADSITATASAEGDRLAAARGTLIPCPGT